jgi:hypothetical protein
MSSQVPVTIHDIPYELIDMCMEYLPLKNLFSSSQVSTLWRRLALGGGKWEKAVQANFPLPEWAEKDVRDDLPLPEWAEKVDSNREPHIHRYLKAREFYFDSFKCKYVFARGACRGQRCGRPVRDRGFCDLCLRKAVVAMHLMNPSCSSSERAL